MRLAFISYEFPPDTGKGGIGTYVSQIAGLMYNAGLDVHVFAGSNSRSETCIENGVVVHRFLSNNPFEFSEFVVPIFSKVNEEKAFNAMESPEIHGNALQIKKKYSDLKLIVRFHAPNYLVEHLKNKYVPFLSKARFVIGALRRGKWDTGYWRKYNFSLDADYKFSKMADVMVAPSSVMKKWVVNNWEINEDAISILPNPFIPPQGLLSLPIHTSVINKEILFFGRLNVLKGLVNATKAMKRILLENPSYSFKVIGDDGQGPSANIKMRKWMQEELGSLNTQVNFIDGVAYEELPAAIANAEIVLLPSLFESFSYTCAEAMAAGKAIVGSIGTGMQDLLLHNESGILVNPEKWTEIYNAINKLINENSFRHQLSINARRSVVDKFDSKKIEASYVNFYKNCIKESE